jgi:hypothetical protein
MSENPLSLRDLPQRGRTNPVNITGFQPPFQGSWGVDPGRQGLSGEVFEMKELKL